MLRNFNDGQQVVASGKLSLYEARGEYQLIVEEIVEAGMGVLYQRFEELKIKLANEGLFNPERKNHCPEYPTQLESLHHLLEQLSRTFCRLWPVDSQ